MPSSPVRTFLPCHQSALQYSVTEMWSPGSKFRSRGSGSLYRNSATTWAISLCWGWFLGGGGTGAGVGVGLYDGGGDTVVEGVRSLTDIVAKPSVRGVGEVEVDVLRPGRDGVVLW